MIWHETDIQGVWVLDVDRKEDNRGFFARIFCVNEFKEHGIEYPTTQCNATYNRVKGTIRGMHYQLPPNAEAKYVRCVRGAILDVVVDLRPGSPTYLRHVSVELTAENRRAIYIPRLFAHGYQTLADDTEVHYQNDNFYAPALARGIRFDDPKLGIRWPLPVTEVSRQDLNWVPFTTPEAGVQRA